MKRSPSALTLIALGGIVWLVLLGCRTADLLARAGATPTRLAARTALRPTFTPKPPTPLAAVAPTDVPVIPTRAPTARPTPTRTRTPAPTAVPPTPIPVAPTSVPTTGPFYRAVIKPCAVDGNTRIVGTVYESGNPANGIKVRVSSEGPGGSPAINDFITGVDPNDPKRQDDSNRGKYRLALYEGQQKAGNWYVFVLNNLGDVLSTIANVQTTDGPGCNTATVDFVH